MAGLSQRQHSKDVTDVIVISAPSPKLTLHTRIDGMYLHTFPISSRPCSGVVGPELGKEGRIPALMYAESEDGFTWCVRAYHWKSLKLNGLLLLIINLK